MRHPFLVGATALFMACLFGCSSGTPSQSGNTVQPSTLVTGLVDSFCAAQSRCCGAGGASPADGGASDAGGSGTCGTVGTSGDGGAATCQARAALSASQQLSLVTTAFNEGLLTIDPATTTACAAAYQNTSCADLAGLDGPNVQAALDDPACAGLFVGYIPVGERCDMTAECVSGSFCLSQGTGQPVTSIFGSGSLGTCFAYQQVGDPCNTSNDCQPPATCSPSSFLCE